MKKRLLSMFLVLAMMFTFVACNKPADGNKENTENKESSDNKDNKENSDSAENKDNTENKEKVVTVGITNNPKDFNAADPGDSASTTLCELMYSPLVSLNNNLEYEPVLAEEVTSEDGKEYTVKLRDAKWTDGEAVTADDVLFTMKFIQNKETQSMIAYNFSALEGFDKDGHLSSEDMPGVVKVDDKTVKFVLKAPMSRNLFMDNILKMILTVPEHVWGKFDPKTYKEEAEVIKPTVTSGPMMLEEYTQNQAVIFKPNKDYFMGSPIINKLVIKIIDGNDYRAQYETKGIDMNFPMIGTIPSTDYEAIKSMDFIKTTSGQPSTLQFLFVNHDNLKDKRVRQAISYAIDREMIVKDILKGQGEPVDTFFSSFNPYRVPGWKVTERNVDEAKKLLKESGYDVKRPITFNVPTGNKVREQAAVVIAENLKEIGLEVKIEKMDMPTCMSKAKSGEFDLAMMGDTLVPTNPIYDLPFFITSGNFNRYSNPEIDKIVEDIKHEVNDDKMKELCYKMQEIHKEDQPMIIIYGQKDLYATNKRMIVGEPKDYGTFLDVYKWDVE